MGSLEMLRAHNTMRDLGDQKNKETSEPELKPLRYNPGLKCDPELEALRPERLSKHTPMPSGDWKRYLIKTQPSYEGSFADADIQKFRPNPTPSLMEDAWYVSRLPNQATVSGLTSTPVASLNSYSAPYPSDQLQQIKMRNRRFQQSCAMEGAQQRPMGPPQMMMQNNQMTEDMMMVATMAYSDLQRQVNLLQTLPSTPLQPPRLNMDEDLLTVDMLPAPRKVIPKTEEVKVEPVQISSKNVGVAMGDQIAIRSYVLGKSL